MTTISAEEYKLNFQIPKRMKYRNIKTVIDGIKFDSKRESNYYLKLKLLIKAGEVKSFTMQNVYKLEVNGVLVCKYISDFDVWYTNGQMKVIDVKGVKTEGYKLKKKLMKAVHNIVIFEV